MSIFTNINNKIKSFFFPKKESQAIKDFNKSTDQEKALIIKSNVNKTLKNVFIPDVIEESDFNDDSNNTNDKKEGFYKNLNEKIRNHHLNYEQDYFDEGLKNGNEKSHFLTKEGFKEADLVLYDPQVRACYNTLIFSVLKKKYSIKIADSDSKEAQDLKAFIDFCINELEGNIYDICYSFSLSMMHYGYACSEKIYCFSEDPLYFGKLIIKKIKSKKAGVFKFVTDLYDNIRAVRSLFTMSNENLFSPDDFIIGTFLKIFGDHYGQDLFGTLNILVKTKRQTFSQMIISNIKFASGTVTIEIPDAYSNDPNTKSIAESIIRNIQSGSGVIYPEGLKIEILEAKTATKDIYLDRLHYIDSQISLSILSNDLTTTQSHGGGTRAESQVKYEVTGVMALYLQRYLEEMINEQIISDLCSYNFDKSIYKKSFYPKIEFIEEKEEDKLKLSAIFVQMIEKGVLRPVTRINDEIFIRQQLNLPELDKDEVNEIVKQMKQKQIDLQVQENKKVFEDKNNNSTDKPKILSEEKNNLLVKK